jgi:hypothetical protein
MKKVQKKSSEICQTQQTPLYNQNLGFLISKRQTKPTKHLQIFLFSLANLNPTLPNQIYYEMQG